MKNRFAPNDLRLDGKRNWTKIPHNPKRPCCKRFEGIWQCSNGGNERTPNSNPILPHNAISSNGETTRSFGRSASTCWGTRCPFSTLALCCCGLYCLLGPMWPIIAPILVFISPTRQHSEHLACLASLRSIMFSERMPTLGTFSSLCMSPHLSLLTQNWLDWIQGERDNDQGQQKIKEECDSPQLNQVLHWHPLHMKFELFEKNNLGWENDFANT